MLRRTVITGSLVLAVLLPAAAPAYPPVTCGRITVKGTSYVVRSHGPACGKAISWSRTFITRHRAPTGFRCRSYGASVPVSCVRKGKKNTYFSATK